MTTNPADLRRSVFDAVFRLRQAEEALLSLLQRLDAEPEPTIEPEPEPVAAKLSETEAARQARNDRILDLWRANELTQKEIARSVDLDPRTVRTIIKTAAENGDPRAITRRHWTTLATSSQGVSRSLRKNASDSLARDPAGANTSPADHMRGSEEDSTARPTDEAQAGNEPGSAEPAPEPVSAAAPDDGSPIPSSGVSETLSLSDAVEAVRETMATPSMTLCGPRVDVRRGVIDGRDGVLRGLDRHIARVVKHMADGGLYPLKLLTEKGGYNSVDETRQQLKIWGTHLNRIGYQIVWYGKEMVYLTPSFTTVVAGA